MLPRTLSSRERTSSSSDSDMPDFEAAMYARECCGLMFFQLIEAEADIYIYIYIYYIEREREMIEEIFV